MPFQEDSVLEIRLVAVNVLLNKFTSTSAKNCFENFEREEREKIRSEAAALQTK